ncbi:MAG: GAF domain-containing protein [Oscillatoriales cyanobacterium]|nr:MAG: GAF domain-containing protein [Oscillatoriales cyanobacterium]
MSDREGSVVLTNAEVLQLQAEVDRLAARNAALQLQHELLASWVITARMTTASNLMLRALTQQILESLQSLCQAEQGSIFLLDAQGQATECLLARGSTIREQKREIVNQILQEGLAAWTIQRREIALVTDSMDDERWLQLPNQPYTVRSALCIPVQRGKRLLALVTLMHSQPHYFGPGSVEQSHVAAEAIALSLENAMLYQTLSTPDNPHESAPSEAPSLPSVGSSFSDDSVVSGISNPASSIADQRTLEDTGLLIATAEGRLRYVNRAFAQIFGYRRRDLAKIESILDLIPVDYQAALAHKLEHCIRSYEHPLTCISVGRHRNGQLMSLEFYAERIHFSGEPGVIGLVRRVDLLPSPEASYNG